MDEFKFSVGDLVTVYNPQTGFAMTAQYRGRADGFACVVVDGMQSMVAHAHLSPEDDQRAQVILARAEWESLVSAIV